MVRSANSQPSLDAGACMLEGALSSAGASGTEGWLLTVDDFGLIFATRAASASRGLMERATSSGVAPLGTSFLLPSGSVTWMLFSAIFRVLTKFCKDTVWFC